MSVARNPQQSPSLSCCSPSPSWALQDSYAAAVRACGNSEEGRRLHQQIVARGCGADRFLCNLLVQMYGRFGSIREARQVFESTNYRNAVSWNIMITAYAQNGHYTEALLLYKCMDLRPTRATFLVMLDVCSALRDLNEGRAVHAEMARTAGMLSQQMIGNSLVHLYGKCGSLQDAQAVFDTIQDKDVVAWTSLIAAYAQNGHMKGALVLFQHLDLEGIRPDEIAFSKALEACLYTGDIRRGQELHERIINCGYKQDPVTATELVTMYSKLGMVNEAEKVFASIRAPTVTLWNAMIAARVHSGYSEGATKLYQRMQLSGTRPDHFTLASVVTACSCLQQGMALHQHAAESSLDLDIVVHTALINMYSRCGSLGMAKDLFHRNQQGNRDLAIWNAMIGGYAQHGHTHETFLLLWEMQQEGILPDELTFTSVLHSCSHAGLVQLGISAFSSMVGDYSGVLVVEEQHYSCVCDLLARLGSIDSAEEVLGKIPVCKVAWKSLLWACICQNDTRAAVVAERSWSAERSLA